MKPRRFGAEDDRDFPTIKWQPRTPPKPKHPSEIIREEREKDIADAAKRGLTLSKEYLTVTNEIVRVWSDGSRTFSSLPKRSEVPSGPPRFTG